MVYRIGTAHFISRDAANRYYGDPNTAGEKFAEGAIFIGKPTCEADERIVINRQEGRYFIEIGGGQC